MPGASAIGGGADAGMSALFTAGALVGWAIWIAERVIALDPNFAGGYSFLSFNLSAKVGLGQSASPEEDLERALTLARKARSRT